MLKKNKYEIDMCNGSIMDKLISFSLPLMLSSILQLMFNAVDIIVVGRFTGSQALAAVGSTTALISIFTNLFIGVSLGANVLAAGYYASGKDREMSEAVHTAITLALISGILMAFVGLGMSRPALELMGTPGDVIDQSVVYIREHRDHHYAIGQARHGRRRGHHQYHHQETFPPRLERHDQPVGQHLALAPRGFSSHATECPLTLVRGRTMDRPDA